jgi:hypothetical protein
LGIGSQGWGKHLLHQFLSAYTAGGRIGQKMIAKHTQLLHKAAKPHANQEKRYMDGYPAAAEPEPLPEVAAGGAAVAMA